MWERKVVQRGWPSSFGQLPTHHSHSRCLIILKGNVCSWARIRWLKIYDRNIWDKWIPCIILHYGFSLVTDNLHFTCCVFSRNYSWCCLSRGGSYLELSLAHSGKLHDQQSFHRKIFFLLLYCCASIRLLGNCQFDRRIQYVSPP